jgi:hypothetical protein
LESLPDWLILRVAIIWTNALKKFLFTLGLLYLVLALCAALRWNPRMCRLLAGRATRQKNLRSPTMTGAG